MSDRLVESLSTREEEKIAITDNGRVDGTQPSLEKVSGQVEQLIPKSMMLIGVSLPTIRNNGVKVSAADWEIIFKRASDDFGGYSVYPHGSGGCNCGCDIPCRDAIHKLEIAVEDSPELLDTIINFGHFIRQHLDQMKVFITLGDVKAVYIE